MEETVSLAQLGYILLRNRRIIAISTLGAILVSAAISLVLPKWYKARATILPPETSTSRTDIVGIMRYAGYQPALLPTITSPSEIYATILESDRVVNAVIDSLGLIEAYGVKNRHKAIAKVKKQIEVAVTPEGLVKIEYEDRDRTRSAEVANAFVTELDRFNKDTRVTTAKRVRQFIEGRMGQAIAELEAAETQLKRFKEATGAVLISEQTRASIETAADIYGQIAELEVSLERLGQFATAKSPEVMDIRSQIRALTRKLAEMGYIGSEPESDTGSRLFPRFDSAPGLEKRLGELLREVEIKRSVYRVLSEQYEEAKIQEMRDTPTVQVLDWAHPPLVRSKPKRKTIVAVSGAFAFLLSSFLVFSGERKHGTDLSHTSNGPGDIVYMLRSDLRAVGELFRKGRAGP